MTVYTTSVNEITTVAVALIEAAHGGKDVETIKAIVVGLKRAGWTLNDLDSMKRS